MTASPPRRRAAFLALQTPALLRKWLPIAVLIGIVAGVGAIVFYEAIALCTQLFLGTLAGYAPPSPVGEGNAGIVSASRPWALPLIVALGGLLSGIIVFTWAPEAEGHGTDAAIAAFHFHGGYIRPRVPIIKLIASAITIGSGGSGGREGPTAQISAGFGSALGHWLKLDDHDRRIAVATGIGAGIGAIFRAPLGGAVLAAEILYKDDLETEALIPGLVASIIGYTIFGALTGWTPIFGEQATLHFDEPVRLLYYAVMGVACGLVGILYSRSFYGIGGLFKRWRFPVILKPAIGGLLVGGIGLVIPPVLGTGYGWVQVGMDQRLLGLPLWLVLVIPFAKILATSLSIGSGGSGGIFGPGMVIGGLLGASLWRLAYAAHLPGLPPTAAPFVIVAMMALFGGIAHAPLAVMLMVAEMSGNLSLLAPAMVAVGISAWIVGQNTIYESQLPSRADSPAHRLEMAFPLLATLTAADAMQPLDTVLRPQAPLAEAALVLAGIKSHGAVVADDGQLLGVLTEADVERVPEADRASTAADQAMTGAPVAVAAGESLETALARLIDRRVSWLPVVDVPNGSRLVGVLPIEAVVHSYRAHVSSGVRDMKEVVQETLASTGDGRRG